MIVIVSLLVNSHNNIFGSIGRKIFFIVMAVRIVMTVKRVVLVIG